MKNLGGVVGDETHVRCEIVRLHLGHLPPGQVGVQTIMESHIVTGIAFSKDEAQISVRHIEDKPGVAAAIFGPLADANINVDMIVQNVSEDGATTDLTFTVPASDYIRARDTITGAKVKIGYGRLDSRQTCSEHFGMIFRAQ